MNIPINIETLLTGKVVESELQHTEGRGAGIPTIMKVLAENGSNTAIFDTDEPRRSYFFVEIPIHPDFIVASTDQVENQDKVLIDNDKEVRNQVRNQVGNQVRNQVVDRIIMVLNYCIEPKTKKETLDKIGISRQSKYFIENIGPAIGAGFLEMTIPDKPTSKSQKYITTEKGIKVLSR